MWISACAGLVSLSIVSADFMRIHARCAWSGAPPHALLLGLIDVSPGTWWRSLLIGAHAFSSLAARALFYVMFSLTLNVSFFDARHNPGTKRVVAPLTAGLPRYGPGLDQWPTWVLQGAMTVALIVSVAFNVVLLSGMRSWACIPSGVVNGFTNIPWTAAPPGLRMFSQQRAMWPSWVFQVVYGGATVVLSVLTSRPTRYVSPCPAKPGEPAANGYAIAYLNWIGGVRPDGGWWGGARAAAVAVPVTAVLLELLFFCVMNAVVWRERRRGDGGPAAAAAAGAPAPALAYRFMWFKKPYVLCAVRFDPLIGVPVALPAGSGTASPPPLPISKQAAGGAPRPEAVKKGEQFF